MTQLPSYYTRGSALVGVFHHTLVERTDRKAIYKVEFQPAYDSEKRIPMGFEYFQVKQQKEINAVMNGVQVHYEAKEMTPSDESFGRWAWNSHSWESAKNGYDNMVLPEITLDENGEVVKKGRGRPRKNVA